MNRFIMDYFNIILMVYDSRIKRLQKSMKSNFVIIASEDYNSNMFYFTGFKGYGVLIIPKKGKSSILATKLDSGNIKNKKLKLIVIEKKIADILKKTVPKNKTIGFDLENLNTATYLRLKKTLNPRKVFDVSESLRKLREIKDNYEISQIKKASLEACDIMHKCLKQLHNFKYEYGIKHYLESEVKRRGYDLAFDTIVASGKNASNPHYSSCKDKLRRGFLVIDFGIKVNGYCTDMTRTLFLGKPSEEEKELYSKVLTVQKNCIKMITKKLINVVDEYARKELGKEFIHSLGHGIGLDIHETPRISYKNKSKLQSKVCFTIEPAVYKNNKYGIRIEDSLVKINNKVKILTPLTKELIIINNKVYK